MKLIAKSYLCCERLYAVGEENSYPESSAGSLICSAVLYHDFYWRFTTLIVSYAPSKCF